MGLIKKWMENSLDEANKCSNTAKILKSHKRTKVILSFDETGTFFALVLAGLITTALIFGVEFFKKGIMWSKHTKKSAWS